MACTFFDIWAILTDSDFVLRLCPIAIVGRLTNNITPKKKWW